MAERDPKQPDAGGKNPRVRQAERQKPWAEAQEQRMGYPSEQPSDEEAAHEQEDSRQKPNTDPPQADRPVDEDPAG